MTSVYKAHTKRGLQELEWADHQESTNSERCSSLTCSRYSATFNITRFHSNTHNQSKATHSIIKINSIIFKTVILYEEKSISKFIEVADFNGFTIIIITL